MADSARLVNKENYETLSEVPTSEETFNIRLKALHQSRNRSFFSVANLPNRPQGLFVSVTLCVSVEVFGQTPAGSWPGRDGNEKLFTMTPDTWHIQV